jgi:hypothetical protein
MAPGAAPPQRTGGRVTLDESVSGGPLTVLEQLSHAERTAFVRDDAFDAPFGDVAEVGGRTPRAILHLASWARRCSYRRAQAAVRRGAGHARVGGG